MMAEFLEDADLIADVQALPVHAIALEPSQIEQAIAWSDPMITEAQQWRTYLNALALAGVQQWLREQAPRLGIDWQNCSLIHPHYANIIDAIFSVTVGTFKLVIVVGDATHSGVNVPRAVVDLPEYMAHFYVAVQVFEEEQQAHVWGFLRYDQLMAHQSRESLATSPDWSYHLPAIWFDTNLHRLLLHLQCLDANAIPLPTPATDPARLLSTLRDVLSERLASPASRNRPLWQQMTWDEGAIILRNPRFLQWLYAQQRDGGTTATGHHLTEILHLLTQPAINVGRWLHNQLDSVAEELSWMLLPSLALQSPLRSLPPRALPSPHPNPVWQRSPAEELDIIVTQLNRLGVQVSSAARSGCRELSQTFSTLEVPLMVYAITWALPAIAQEVRWTLLLIVGTRSGLRLPVTLRLRVSDDAAVLVEQTPDPSSEDSFLYVQVSGTREETFLATIMADSTTLTLPPFVFQPEPPESQLNECP